MAADQEEDEIEVVTETKETTEPELTVMIEGASPAPEDDENAALWVKELRKGYREQIRRNKELEEQLNQLKPNKAAEIGTKPTLESCNYEEDKFETALTQWNEAKRKQAETVAAQEAEAKRLNESWQESLATYGRQKSELKVKDVDVAEEVVKDVFSVMQQGIIVSGCNNSALVIYALGTHEAEARKLASIKDPVKFAFAVARLEGSLKLAPKKPPAPEKIIRTGGTPLTSASAKELEKLRAEAAKTGDYTKVVAYKKQAKAANR